jgi:hypothetical protein
MTARTSFGMVASFSLLDQRVWAVCPPFAPLLSGTLHLAADTRADSSNGVGSSDADLDGACAVETSAGAPEGLSACVPCGGTGLEPFLDVVADRLHLVHVLHLAAIANPRRMQEVLAADVAPYRLAAAAPRSWSPTPSSQRSLTGERRANSTCPGR